jgi:tetratricopeptide (TPR) repeat protein
MNIDDLKSLEKKYQSVFNTDEAFILNKQYREYLEIQLQLNPLNVHLLVQLGALLWEPFHQSEKAIELLEQAIQLDPKNIEARFWLAECVFHDYCNWEKAKRLLNEALDIDPNRADCLMLIAIITEDDDQDWFLIIDILKRVIELEPTWSMPVFFIARTYLKVNDVLSAKNLIPKLISFTNYQTIRPKNFLESYYELTITGRVNFKLKEKLKDLQFKIENIKLS